MKNFSCLLCLFVLSCLSVALTGCSASFAPATGQTAASVVNGPAISGSVYGGHAPLVGAKVYVLSPSTTATGSAALSTSLMNSTSSTTGGSAVTKDTSGGVTNDMYYVTTDATGQFNLTGDYTCTVNQPVYIAAVGGAPTFPSNTGTVFVTGVSEVSTTGTGSTQTGTLTFTTASTELFYVGELVTLTGFTGDLAYLNNSVQTVLPNNLSTTQFEATLGTWNGTKDINATYTGLTGKAGALPPSNPAAVNMAALGLCPPSGSFAGTISFIYMNEISTVAMAYATAAFGSDAFHIGVDETGTLNTSVDPGYVTGSMTQAFNNAALLYDITGSNVSTTFAGEGHIARLTTPAGNGTVPQSLINTLGNTLAACVDSANSSSGASNQCTTLFSYATLDGTLTGTKPTDIAAAAFNIAHYPAGTSSANFISKLFNLPTGNVPFAPNLSTAPKDFSIGIQFRIPSTSGGTGSLVNSPIVLALDAQPAVGTEYNDLSSSNALWIGNYNGQPLKLFANGTPDYTTNSAANFSAATRSRSVTVDTSSNVWIVNESTNALQKFSGTGGLLTNLGAPTNPNTDYFNGTSVTADASGNLFVDYADTIVKYNSAGANIPYTGGAANANWSSNNTNLQGTNVFTYVTTLDSNGLLYTINSNNTLIVADPNSGATKATVANVPVYVNSYAIMFPAVDANNTLWCTYPTNNQLLGYNYASNANALSYTYTGGGLNNPASVAVDGAGNIWVVNAGNSSLSEFTAGGTALSPTTGFGQIGTTNTNSSQLTIDRAGDVWVAYSNLNYIVEEIGLAAPTIAVPSYATFNGFLGKRPK